MTGRKVVEKLFRFKELRVVDFGFEGRENFVITVEPYKNGCQCPQCGRRCEIVDEIGTQLNGADLRPRLDLG